MKNFYRALDANFNRAREGLRVLEDVSRFMLADRELTASFRRARHELSARVSDFCPRGELLSHRSASTDQGRNFAGRPRRDIAAVAAANGCRVSEALRVIEELSGLEDRKAVNFIRDLRFAFYEAEKELSSRLSRLLPAGCLYVVVNNRAGAGQAVANAREAISRGAGIIHFEPGQPVKKSAWTSAKAIRRATLEAGVFFIVSDRLDLAMACGADGFYATGKNLLPLREARRLWAGRALGIEAGGPGDGEKAIARGADFIGIRIPGGSPDRSAEITRPAGKKDGVGQHRLVIFGLDKIGDFRQVLDAGLALCAIEAGTGNDYWPTIVEDLKNYFSRENK